MRLPPLFWIFISEGTCNIILYLYTVQVFPPHQYVVVAGGTATFQCFSLHGNVISVQWLVNGSQNHTLANVMKEMRGSLGLFTLANIPVEYNMTNISCEVILGSSIRETAQEGSTLLVQGVFN